MDLTDMSSIISEVLSRIYSSCCSLSTSAEDLLVELSCGRKVERSVIYLIYTSIPITNEMLLRSRQ
jgi:hypothetical protein